MPLDQTSGGPVHLAELLGHTVGGVGVCVTCAGEGSFGRAAAASSSRGGAIGGTVGRASRGLAARPTTREIGCGANLTEKCAGSYALSSPLSRSHLMVYISINEE